MDMSVSVIIPAYNEEAGIGHVLDTLVNSPDYGPDIEVIVAPNGCRDRTADVARQYGVRVVEVAQASKTAALNAADAVASYPNRIYLDADIPVSPATVRQLTAAVSAPGVHGAVPRPVVDTKDSSWTVRRFYDINAKLPVFRNRLFGRGVIAISGTARARFRQFPDIIADDLFLDALVAPQAKTEIDVPVHIAAPRTTGDLVRRVARAKDGNDEFQAWAREVAPVDGIPLDGKVAGPATWSWLKDVALPRPRLWPAAVCYVAVTLVAGRKRRSRGWSARSGWGRPDSQPTPSNQAPGPVDERV
jgi:glycosyltransferase involved in cell wall biosynthesis